MRNYKIIYEKSRTGYSAYAPAVPGCGATGRTRKETEANLRDAIAFHLEGLKLYGPGPMSLEKHR